MNKEESIKRIRLLIQDECTCEACKKNKEAYKFVLDYIEDLEETNQYLSRLVEDTDFVSSQVILDKIEELKHDEKFYECFPEDYMAEISINILKEILKGENNE